MYQWRTYTTLIACCCTSLLLSACLPGESESKKVLARTAEASLSQQAEQIATGMLSATAKLAATEEAVATDVETNDLHVIHCADKAVAYIPTTAKLAADGELPPQIANRMRTFLETRVGSSNVTNAASAPACVDIETIASNSPVLVMDLKLAALVVPEDDSLIASISMAPCGGGQPGVIITKHKNDGTTTVENHCGDAAPASSLLPSISLTDGTIANWKNRLSGSATAITNFTCIAGSAGCAPVDPDVGTEIQCDDQTQSVSYYSNAKFDTASYSWKASSEAQSCGKGWTGEMISRMKTKRCRVKRNGVWEERPTNVYDIAFVGAKCYKNSVPLHDVCPAGFPNSDAGVLPNRKNINMTRPFALVPTASSSGNVSVLGYKNTISTNLPSDILPLTTSNFDVIYPSSGSFSLMGFSKLIPTHDNLSGPVIAAPGVPASFVFDSNLVKEISHAGNGTIVPTTCYGNLQTCQTGKMPEMLSVVVDRSGSMNGWGSEEVTPRQTFCRATMANLFPAGPARTASCQAAKKWQQIADKKASYRTARENIKTAYAATRATDPVGYMSGDGYDSFMSHLSFTDRLLINAPMSTLTTNVKDDRFIARMKYGLMIGQDCYPEAVRDDTYGICAPVFANKTELAAANYNAAPLNTCQSSCPGSCITDAAAREPAFPWYARPNPFQIYPSTANVPKSTTANRMKIVDSFVQTNLLPNVPFGAKIVYSEFGCDTGGTCDSVLDDDGHGNIGHRPVRMDVGDTSFDPSIPSDSVDMSFWVRRLSKIMDNKFSARSSDPRGNTTPLYQSVDRAIHELRVGVLDNTSSPKYGPEATTGMIILTDGAQTGASYDPYYFNGNFCQKEMEPEKFVCVKKRSCGFLGWDTCYDRIDVDQGSVRSEFSNIDTTGTRKAWCHARDYKHDVEKVNKSGGKMVHYDSLVGFIGRHYPNTKIYYLDVGNTAISTQCDGDNAEYEYEPGKTRKIVHVFKYDTSSSDTMYKAFNSFASGSAEEDVPFEIAKRVCEAKLGVGIPINMTKTVSDMPIPPRPTSINNTILPSCEGYAWLNLDNPSAPPPINVPNPLVSSDLDNLYGGGTSTAPGVGDTCMHGWDRDTMGSCTGP